MTLPQHPPSTLAFTPAVPLHRPYPPPSLAIARHSSAPQLTKWTTTTHRSSPLMHSHPGDKHFPEDFDRDYYDDLKAKYAHLPNVKIFSNRDYHIDPREIPWLTDDPRPDLHALRRNVNETPVQPGELPDAEHRPFRHSDLHTPEEIAAFESQCREGDPVSGRVWHDPMPDSDFDGDEEWIDLRKMDAATGDDSDEDVFANADPKPLRRKQYASMEEEFAAVKASADRMQAENLDQPIPKTAWAESVPIPDPADFAKWQKAAEERGGNSTRNESHFLPPAKKLDAGADSDSFGNSEREFALPLQHHSLVDAHVGSWTGELAVFSVSANRFSVQQLKRCVVRSKTSISTDDGLEWSSAITDDGMEIASEVVFAPVEQADSLLPGRGVSSDGSYVQNSPTRGSSEKSSEYTDISISQKFLQALTGNRNCKGEIEICMLSSKGSKVVRRNRIVLCTATHNNAPGKRSRKSAEIFAFVVVLSELPSSEMDQDASYSASMQRRAISSARVMQGDWAGKGVIVHPEFPPYACKEVRTRLSFSPADRIKEDDVTWVENKLADEPEVVSRGRQRTLAKKKVSKRVAAARAYDRKRLSECGFLSREETGKQSKTETHAWNAIPSANEFTCLLSPRIGKFADDYCAIVLPGEMLVTFPYGKAFPDMWNTVNLTQLSRPVRQRIVAGRNEFGDLVGVLFITESVTDEALCDEAAMYV